MIQRWKLGMTVIAAVLVLVAIVQAQGPERSSAPAEGMTWWQAVVLGVVEGVTEYLPVSSTGHLILTQRAMGMAKTTASDAYAICIQGGAILAVLSLYFRRVKQMSLGLAGRDPVGRKLAIALFVAVLPLGLAYVLEKPVKANLFNLWAVTAAWFVGGVAIVAVSVWRKQEREQSENQAHDLDGMTWSMGLIIGLAQIIAIWPGTSRSLVTIVAGVLVGLRLRAAVEFSFLLGVVTLSAATAKDFLEYRVQLFEAYGALTMAIGFVVAFFSAVVAVKWMVSFLNKHGMAIFGYYRIALAIVVAALLLTGILQNQIDTPKESAELPQAVEALSD